MRDDAEGGALRVSQNSSAVGRASPSTQSPTVMVTVFVDMLPLPKSVH